MLNEKEVKITIHKNQIEFREFYVDKVVYGYVKDSQIIAMVSVSENKQILGGKKLFTPWVYKNNRKIARSLVQDVIRAIKSIDDDVIIYADVLKHAVEWFKSSGFTVGTAKFGLKRYDELWRVVYNG